MPRQPIPDELRCTATTSRGRRCRCRRVDGRDACEIHDDVFQAFWRWLHVPRPGAVVSDFDADRADWAAHRR